MTGPPEDRPPPGESGAKEDATVKDDAALLGECRVDTFRAGGAGGQHQNTTDSGVRLTHGPTGIVVVARDHRSQHRNRQLALARLREALEARIRRRNRKRRIPTRVPRREKERRLREKRRRAELKRRRKPPPAP